MCMGTGKMGCERVCLCEREDSFVRTFDYIIKDASGIHARPAGMLTKLAKDFQSEITITKGEKTVEATKLMALMGMGIKCGETITVTIKGADEEAAQQEIRAFLESNL